MATQTATTTAVELEDVDHIHVSPKADPDIELQPSFAGRAPSSAGSPPVSDHPPVQILAESPKLPLPQAWILIVQLVGNNFINSFSAGLLMVCLPTMARDLNLDAGIIAWPTSVAYLASASCQLIAGSVADVLGPRRLNTAGSFLQCIFIIATGLARNGPQLIAFRAVQGIATSMFSTSGRSMLSTNIERGRLRNFTFAAFILAFPLGAGIGLVLGGIYAEKASWRVGYYSSGALGMLLSLSSVWTLPPDPRKHASFAEARKRLAAEIDWVGVVMASASVTILSYVLAVLSTADSNIYDAANIVLLIISLALIPAFAVWMRYQEKRQKPTLIPNLLWKDGAFTSVCIMIGLSNAAQSGLTLFVSLFFQEVQLLSPYQASLRLLPQAVTGCLMCLLVGVFVNRVSPWLAIVSTMAVCSVSPLLMAITKPAWPYWYTAFLAQVLGPLSIDVMFVVGALVVADAFSGQQQARGSAVFGTFSQLGSSIGLCVMSVISNSVIDASDVADKAAPDALLKGYRASFWTQFGWIVMSCLVGAIGLRKLGQVGMKRE